MGSAIQYSFVKTSELMKKNYALFVVSLRSALTVHRTFQSIREGPIGDVANFLCFDETTNINISNNLTKNIKDIRIGETLPNNSRVIGTLEFSSKNVDMYNYKNVIVSGSHLVNENNTWLRICDSNISRKIDNYNGSKIYCLMTTNNLIEIDDIIFRDYIEYNDNYTNNKMKEYILEHLNNTEYRNRINIGDYYTFGFKQGTKVKMINNCKTIETIRIGDKTINGKVNGIIKICNTTDMYTDGTNYFSGNNIIKTNNTWKLASDNNFRSCGRLCNILYHITTDDGIITLENGTQFTDFEETTDENINDTIDRMVLTMIEPIN